MLTEVMAGDPRLIDGALEIARGEENENESNRHGEIFGGRRTG